MQRVSCDCMSVVVCIHACSFSQHTNIDAHVFPSAFRHLLFCSDSVRIFFFLSLSFKKKTACGLPHIQAAWHRVMLHSWHPTPPIPSSLPPLPQNSPLPLCVLSLWALGKRPNILNRVWFETVWQHVSLRMSCVLNSTDERWSKECTQRHRGHDGIESLTHHVAECQQWGLACGSVLHGQPGQHNLMQPCWGGHTNTHWGGHSWSAVYPILRLLHGCHGARLIAPLNSVQVGSESGTIGSAPLSPPAQKSLLQMPLWKDGSLSSVQAAGSQKSIIRFNLGVAMKAVLVMALGK